MSLSRTDLTLTQAAPERLAELGNHRFRPMAWVLVLSCGFNFMLIYSVLYTILRLLDFLALHVFSHWGLWVGQDSVIPCYISLASVSNLLS